MVKVFCGILLSLVLGMNIAYAADWNSIHEKIKAKYADFDKQFQDMALVEEVTMVGAAGQMMPTTSKSFHKGKKIRTESSMIHIPNMPEGMGDMQSITIDDGLDVWMISSFGGKHKLSGKELQQHRMHDSLRNLFPDKGTIIATEVVDGRECYVVEFDKDYATGRGYSKVWLDTVDLIPVKGEGKDDSNGDQTMILWSDFKKIKDSDRMMPHTTQIFLNGRLMLKTTIKSIEVNRGISDDLFDPEKVKVQGPDMQDMMKKIMQQKSGN